ncbi:MAG: GvpL/GvpF family gas vesicle protein [Solirubrobacterales bacterium]|nr:GvpL/GvpF family gas vesicle protein [Solirubrobacterales bacterium]
MSEPGVGVYLYCIVSPGSHPELEGLIGVDGRSGVEAITSGELTAITSRVSLEEFGSEPLKRNLEDLEWLERTARAHDAVLAAMMAGDAVVPMRLLTIFTDGSRLLAMLDRERDALRRSLDRLRGHAEWSVKLLVDHRSLERAAHEQARQLAAARAPDSPGRAYFARKQGDRTARQKARELAQAAATEAHATLSAHAAASRRLRPQQSELSGRSGEMILNGAYLVEGAQSQLFKDTAAQLRERHRGAGIDVELSGPWAPYNFADEADRMASAAGRS